MPFRSDGIQPHFINIQFPKRTAVTHVSIYLDHKLDDSYTPTKILIKGGTYFHDLVDIRYREFVEPSGWKTFMMVKTQPRIPEEAELEAYTIAGAQSSAVVSSSTGHHIAAQPLVPIHAWLLQICILGNHLNGKDTHVRGVYIFGPPAEFPTFLAQQPHDAKPASTLDDILFGQKDDGGDDDDLAMGTVRTHGLPNAASSSRTQPATSSAGARSNPQGLDGLPPLSRNLTLGSSVR
ncbi:hypothetical protein OC846_000301 [Tilletia horrida]|uniref:DOC domain-containing protein n=1 Tax=Tilletia horrida TaxID=155126 RepID=A0AAN6H150_9BASI|nr:hypothetical protein OC846_000301 [Tilletia horrida]